ncbi:Imm45 family immunity protein [uncultured Xanthomonas sp.]|uniref:Imm45 family immunity protein n=1 Tax=uncultured Xanthomonas sp. TaxID=152831 RepID=UPI0025F4C1FF|nr:Imm45 family immunity protein [uncultured Xanthomonas sp.]
MYALLNVSGYKAGLIYSILPDGSRPRETGCAVDCEWLIANWNKWCYFECPLEWVYVVDARES